MSAEDFQRIESWIVSGELSKAREALDSISVNQLAIGWLARFASLCRRAGHYDRGLKALRPRIFFSGQKHLTPSTNQEIAEYAALLSRVGGVKQALSMLQKIRGTKSPEVLLYENFCHLALWDFEAAEKVLNLYLGEVETPYLRAVAEVNLVSVLIGLRRFDEALSQIEKTLIFAKQASAVRLSGNLLQLRAQALYWKKKFELALESVDQSSRLFGGSVTQDQFLVKKWEVIIEATRLRDRQRLLDFQRSCFKSKEWETAREVDRFLLHFEIEQRRFDRLFIGTPHPSYRKALELEFGIKASKPFCEIGNGPENLFDLKEVSLNGVPVEEEGSKVMVLLTTLFADYYMPARSAGIFAEVYPDEIFDIESSSLKVRQLFQRLRVWVNKNEIPIQLSEWKSYHRARPAQGASTRVYLSYGFAKSAEEKVLEQARLVFGKANGPEEWFSSSKACAELGLSRSGFLRFINWALEANLVERTGEKNKVKYRLRPV